MVRKIQIYNPLADLVVGNILVIGIKVWDKS
jgi:hypothetical protein